MSNRKPLKVSGLLQVGKINPKMDPDNQVNLHAPVQRANDDSNEIPALQIAASTSPSSNISLDLIDDSPYQPRSFYDASKLDELGHSMAAAGLEEPITVRKKADGRFELIAGHRRVRAARSLGWAEISAYIVEKTDGEAKLATMISNEARDDLTDYERAKLYKESVKEGFAKTQADVANLFGTSQARVSARMAMLNLPPFFIALLDANESLFNADCSHTISQLLKEYPTEQKLIQDAVTRISEEDANQGSVKQWFLQMIKQRSIKGTKKVPKVITNRSGRQVFTAKLDSRIITVRISDPNVDADTTLLKVIDSLRAVADISEIDE